MCGIVGYSGNSDAVAPIIEGLSRLEYRGYDSAGISFLQNHSFEILKKEGKLENLKSEIKSFGKIDSTIGIGHTRWATHGEVNDTNAHPHGNGDFSIVHNGIIENANEIREMLKGEGYEFKSQTDSETFLYLVAKFFKENNSVEEAIIAAFKKVKGNSAFVVIHKESMKLYSIRKSAPLVCGFNDQTSEVYVSSDPYALVGFANRIYFPEDEVLCVSDPQNIASPCSFFDLGLKPTKKYKIQEKEMSLDIASKGEYDHFMLKEIFEQPALIKKLYSIYSSKEGKDALKKLTEYEPSFVHIIACGTALHAGLVVKNFLEMRNGVRAQCDFASEFRYRNPKIFPTELGLFISQSGETADTLASQEMCKEKGIRTYSLVNVEGSSLFRNCDLNLLLHAGVEIGVASTKAFTQMVLVGYLLSKAVDKEQNPAQLEKDFEIVHDAVKKVLEMEDEIKNIAREIYHYKGFIFTGRREQYPIALEGALKLKEIAYVHAEGYPAGELKHGPIALFDENLVNIAIVTEDLYEKTLSNAQEVKARKGVMVIIGENDNKELQEMADHYIGLDYCGATDLKPVITNVVLQLLSYHIANFKGTDIDKPRNLAKSVTVE